MTTGSKRQRDSSPRSWGLPTTPSCRVWGRTGLCCWAPTKSCCATARTWTLLARLPAEQGGHPLLVTGQHGKGRTLAWTSDIGPHWLPDSFVKWPGYAKLWRNALAWVTAGVA